MDSLVTTFKIENQSFLVFKEKLKNMSTSEENIVCFDSYSCNIVGELIVDKERYLIARSEVTRDVNSEKNHKNPTEILTRRELQIVMLVAEGRVNKQIAGQLKISEWTVSTHLRRIFAKLGVDSRSAMVYRCSNLLENCFKPSLHQKAKV